MLGTALLPIDTDSDSKFSSLTFSKFDAKSERLCYIGHLGPVRKPTSISDVITTGYNTSFPRKISI